MLWLRTGLLLGISAFGFPLAIASSPLMVPADHPCSNDIKKYCSDAPILGGKLADCMKQHASQLSAGCKKFGEEYKKEHPDLASGDPPSPVKGGSK
jgi:hypothetical protein